MSIMAQQAAKALKTPNVSDLVAMVEKLTNNQITALNKWAEQVTKLNLATQKGQDATRKLFAQKIDLGNGVSVTGDTAARLLQLIAKSVEASQKRKQRV
jgi:hypothetical protein